MRHKCRNWYGRCQSLLVVGVTLALSACASIYKPQNEPLQQVALQSGYRPFLVPRKDPGSHLVALSFSGGGTRAAALTYGVMQELRDTTIDANGRPVRLLDETDAISSVSGGSFTAAYYGLFGDRLFEDYEDEFLRRSVQGALIRQMLDPVFWWRSLFTGFDRTEMAVEFYDTTIFKGKKFKHIPLHKRPFIEINATNLKTGQRFSFTQGMFDLLCSDLNDFPVARAVTASSAVPVAFPTVVLENHAPACHLEQLPEVQSMLGKPTLTYQEQIRLDRYNDLYVNARENHYIHLVDGGISDNLGLRAILERVEAIGGIQKSFARIGASQKDVMIILVNAAVKPERTMSQVATKPSIGETIDAFTDSQMRLYNVETNRLIKDRMREYEKELAGAGQKVKFYFVEVTFESIKSPSLKNFFNSLPTSLELTNRQVDSLIVAGRTLLRENPEFQAFLAANKGELKEKNTRSSCNPFLNPLCIIR